jgi:hypothetical protein
MRIAAILAATMALAGCAVGVHTRASVSGSRTVTKTVTVSEPPAGTVPGPKNATYFGTPVSITKVDASRYLLALKPQSFLVGVTANAAFAAQQGTQCRPLSCPGVPDDRWVVPAGGRPLTFVLPATTSGTVLVLAHEKMQATTISAAQLAALVGGATTPKLIEPLDSGLWLAVDVDRVTSFVQQFQP